LQEEDVVMSCQDEEAGDIIEFGLIGAGVGFEIGGHLGAVLGGLLGMYGGARHAHAQDSCQPEPDGDEENPGAEDIILASLPAVIILAALIVIGIRRKRGQPTVGVQETLR
jgi:hypothetical protein